MLPFNGIVLRLKLRYQINKKVGFKLNINTREEALEEIEDVLEVGYDNVSLKRIDQYTQVKKGNSYFVKALMKNNLPYAIFNDGEEILIFQMKRTFESFLLQKEYSELIVSNVNRLIKLRDE